MANRPIGVVRQRVDGLDGHHRALERRHAVEGQRHHEELQDRIRAQLVPGTREGHDPVDHAAPRRRQQNQREHHAERLCPVRQRGVLQVVRARPHVGEVQRPEVHDRQAVGIDRSLSLLGHEVIHHAQEAGGQEEAHRVVAVPPLHHRILHAGICRVRLPERHRQLGVVDDMQQRDGDDVSAEEPVGHVDVPGLALDDGAEEDDRVDHPHHSDQDVDRPFELGVFLRACVAQRQGDGGSHDHCLPAPEREGGKLVGKQAHLAGTLHDVVGRRKQRATAKRKDDGIRVQRTQPAVGQPGHPEIQLRPDQLGRDQRTDRHTDDAPDDRHDRELAYHAIVEGLGVLQRAGRFHACSPR